MPIHLTHQTKIFYHNVQIATQVQQCFQLSTTCTEFGYLNVRTLAYCHVCHYLAVLWTTFTLY